MTGGQTVGVEHAQRKTQLEPLCESVGCPLPVDGLVGLQGLPSSLGVSTEAIQHQ